MLVPGSPRLLGVNRNTLNNLVNEQSGISPEMAVRLAKAFGSTPRVWLAMQMEYDLARVEAQAEHIDVKPAPRPEAGGGGNPARA